MEIEKLLHEYRIKAIPYSRARSHRVYLEEYKRSLLSLLLKDAEKKGFTSVSAQERESYSRPEYVKHLDALKDAVEAEEFQRFEIKRIELEIEVWRTSSQRADGTKSLRSLTCEGCKHYYEQFNEYKFVRRCELYRAAPVERCYDFRLAHQSRED